MLYILHANKSLTKLDRTSNTKAKSNTITKFKYTVSVELLAVEEVDTLQLAVS